MINVHIESQGVTCDICEKVVKNKWYLRKHLVTAHGAPLKRAKDGKYVKNINNNENSSSAADEEEMIVVDEDNDHLDSK